MGNNRPEDSAKRLDLFMRTPAKELKYLGYKRATPKPLSEWTEAEWSELEHARQEVLREFNILEIEDHANKGNDFE